MGTIEERADEYASREWYALNEEFNEDHTTFENIVSAAFVAGAKSEREELLRWHDPKYPPAHRKPVLIKGVTPSGRKCLVVGVFYKSGLQTNTYYKVDPIGWREIHE